MPFGKGLFSRIRDRSLHRRLLACAAEDDKRKIMLQLEKHRAEARSVVDREGNTMLHICVDSAARYGKQTTYMECARLLLKSGLSAMQLNNAGRSPLDMATDANLYDMIALLAQHQGKMIGKENARTQHAGTGAVARSTSTSLNTKTEFKCRLFKRPNGGEKYEPVAQGIAKVQVKAACLVFIDEGNEIILNVHLDPKHNPDLNQTSFELRGHAVIVIFNYKTKLPDAYCFRCTNDDKQVATIEATRLHAALQRTRKVR